jgi:gliding motility-associated-like protein
MPNALNQNTVCLKTKTEVVSLGYYFYSLSRFYINILILFYSLFFFTSNCFAQNNCTTSANNTTIKLCATACGSFNFAIPHIKTSADYIVRQKAYQPFPYTTTTGIVDNFLYNDNTFSFDPINIGFPFCFYDTMFNYLTINANGFITFDTTNNRNCLGGYLNLFSIPSNLGDQCNAEYIPKAAILLNNLDLDPRNGFQQPSAPDRKIEYRIEGQAPCRRFIVSFYKIGTWGSWGDPGADCWPNGQATFQAVLYESSGIIEIHLETKTCNRPWASGGRSTLGIQNWARNKAVSPNGHNAAIWTANQESYQFIPSGGASRFVQSKLYALNGTFIANADTASMPNGLLNLAFNNICPTMDTTKYIVKSSFKDCGNNALFTYDDTIIVIRVPINIAATAISTASCGSNGSITTTATGAPSFTYMLNFGAAQISNTFNNLAAGNYYVTATAANGCSSTIPVTIPLSTVQLSLRVDTAICLGNSLILNTISNATNYSWQPNIGLNNAAIANPIATPTVTTQYTLTAKLGQCVSSKSVTISILPKPTVQAGTAISTVLGYPAQLNGNVQAASSFVWSPNTFLSAANILNPVVQLPTQNMVYTLTATNTNGCTDTDNVTVQVLPNCTHIRNAFTPNGDGINDYWLVYDQYACLKNVQVKVYNRMGSLVYENKNYTNNWQGLYHNKAIPDGTYYYSIDFTLINNVSFTKKGDVTILR